MKAIIFELPTETKATYIFGSFVGLVVYLSGHQLPLNNIQLLAVDWYTAWNTWVKPLSVALICGAATVAGRQAFTILFKDRFERRLLQFKKLFSRKKRISKARKQKQEEEE